MKSLKELIERRAFLVMEGRELIDKAESESRGLEKSEDLRFESILAEVESLSKEIDEIYLRNSGNVVSRKDYSKKENFEDLLKDLEKPLSEPIKPQGRVSYESDDTRLYNKSNLQELRSHIRSQGRLLSPDKELSPGKYFYGLISGDWRNAQNEFQLRALTSAEGSGGVFIPEEIASEVIFSALNRAQCVKAGISITPMSSKTKILPKQTSEVETEWKPEGVAFSKSQNITFAPLTLTCKTLMAMITLSVELAEDSPEGIVQAIEEAMAKALATELDNAILNGAVNGIEGVINTSGILTEFYTSIEYADFSQAYTKLQETNCNVNSMIIDPVLMGALDLKVDTLTQPIKPPESWALFQKFPSNALDLQAVMGDFSKIVLGVRSTMNVNIQNFGYGNVESSRVAEDSFKKLNIMIRSYLRADAQVKIPNQICLISPLES